MIRKFRMPLKGIPVFLLLLLLALALPCAGGAEVVGRTADGRYHQL